MLCKLLLPNFHICSFLASPPAPCWMEHSGYSVPSWEWGDGACKDMLTPTRRSRNSLTPLCFPNSSNTPFVWGKGSSQHSQLQGLVASHQCPCLISSDCISLTFYPACLLQTNFWQAPSELGVSGLLHPAVHTINTLHLSNGCVGNAGWAPQHPPPRLLQHPCPEQGRDACFKALGSDFQPGNPTAIGKAIILSIL